jgi:hypothetical protein
MMEAAVEPLLVFKWREGGFCDRLMDFGARGVPSSSVNLRCNCCDGFGSGFSIAGSSFVDREIGELVGESTTHNTNCLA